MRSSPGRMPACSPPRRAVSRATASAYVTGGLARLGRLVREEGQDPTQRLLEVAPVHDQVELPVLQQELRALEALGERLADRLGDDARPAETISAPGSAMITSPSIAKLAVTPPGAGSGRAGAYGRR